MSLVNFDLNVEIPAAEKRTREVTTVYGNFYKACAAGEVPVKASVAVPCPANKVRDNELAKAWVSSMKANLKSIAKKHGLEVETRQTNEGETGLAVRVWFMGKATPAQA